MRNPWVEERQQTKARARVLRQDRRDPRTPLTAPDGHHLGSAICAGCGLVYPWRSYRTQAGTTTHCLNCRVPPP
jgi:hypothetical protein